MTGTVMTGPGSMSLANDVSGSSYTWRGKQM